MLFVSYRGNIWNIDCFETTVGHVWHTPIQAHVVVYVIDFLPTKMADWTKSERSNLCYVAYQCINDIEFCIVRYPVRFLAVYWLSWRRYIPWLSPSKYLYTWDKILASWDRNRRFGELLCLQHNWPWWWWKNTFVKHHFQPSFDGGDDPMRF